MEGEVVRRMCSFAPQRGSTVVVGVCVGCGVVVVVWGGGRRAVCVRGWCVRPGAAACRTRENSRRNQRSDALLQQR